jgi:Sugar transport protein
MWGTMYLPYRKAYISGMNPLSFVTAFTVGELGTMFGLTLCLDGVRKSSVFQLVHSQSLLFWLFLGGFVWAIGDLFRRFAAKYLGIGRGIPLSNTNQLWGLAWGALVFRELAAADRGHKMLVLFGSVLMILGALAISTAVASSREHQSTNTALERECHRYGLDYLEVFAAQSGEEFGNHNERRRWWDIAIVATATGVFLWLGLHAVFPPIYMNLRWVGVLGAILLVALAGAGYTLWRHTRFS